MQDNYPDFIKVPIGNLMRPRHIILLPAIRGWEPNARLNMSPQILIVDDDPIQGSARSAILSRSGLRVAVAQRAEDALKMLDMPEIRAALRLLVTDHLMPGMNGPELASRFRAIMPDLPVLVLSGLASAEEEYSNLNVSFRLKPFPPAELIGTVEFLIGASVLRTA